MSKTISEILSDYFHVGDYNRCYTYNLQRHKSAFDLGSMSIDDFEEWTPDDVSDMAAHMEQNNCHVIGWIPIEERLPTAEDANEYELLLAYSKDSGMMVWHWKLVAHHPDVFKFTHWLPLKNLPIPRN